MEFKVSNLSPWNDALLNQVKIMWHAGTSATRIAAALGPHFTSNMVIGQIHRRKFKRSPEIESAAMMRRVEQRQRHFEHAQRVRKLLALKLQSEREGKVAVQVHHASCSGQTDAPSPSLGPSRQLGTVKLTDLLKYHCRWPEDDGAFCGELRIRGAYCEKHAEAAYRDAYARERRVG